MVLITDNPTLAARGLRLVTPQLQEVEVKQLKTTGKTTREGQLRRRRAVHGLPGEAGGGRQLGERGAEIVGDALVASLLADEDELPQSKRVRGGLRASAEVEKLLSADIKSVRPRRRRRKGSN